MSINSEIIKASEMDDTYIIKTRIMASGAGWHVSGATVEYKLKKINGIYKITDTDLFNKVGFENVFAFIMQIFAIVGGIMFFITLIVVIIVLIVVKKSKR